MSSFKQSHNSHNMAKKKLRTSEATFQATTKAPRAPVTMGRVLEGLSHLSDQNAEGLGWACRKPNSFQKGSLHVLICLACNSHIMWTLRPFHHRRKEHLSECQQAVDDPQPPVLSDRDLQNEVDSDKEGPQIGPQDRVQRTHTSNKQVQMTQPL